MPNTAVSVLGSLIVGALAVGSIAAVAAESRAECQSTTCISISSDWSAKVERADNLVSLTMPLRSTGSSKIGFISIDCRSATRAQKSSIKIWIGLPHLVQFAPQAMDESYLVWFRADATWVAMPTRQTKNDDHQAWWSEWVAGPPIPIGGRSDFATLQKFIKMLLSEQSFDLAENAGNSKPPSRSLRFVRSAGSGPGSKDEMLLEKVAAYCVSL